MMLPLSAAIVLLLMPSASERRELPVQNALQLLSTKVA